MLVDISEVLNETAFKELKKGQILIFNKDGKRHTYRIVRINRKSKKCFAEKIKTYTPEEAQEIARVRKLNEDEQEKQ